MAFEGFGLFLLFGLIAVGVGIFAYVRGRRRTRELEAKAADLGLSFEKHPSEPIERQFKFLSVINQGHSRRARNLMRGVRQGREVRLFDYRFTTGGGKHQQHHLFGVAIARLGAPTPFLRIVPETWDKKLWDALGGDDIDFESDEFSRRFWVKADDRKFAYDVVHPRMMEFLMTPGWSHWELREGFLCLWQRGRYKVAHAHEILDRLHAFAQQVPARLVSPLPQRTAGGLP